MSFVRASLGLAALALGISGLARAQKQFTLAGSDAARLTFGEGTMRGRNALRVLYPSDHLI